jgi:hypothetical protein
MPGENLTAQDQCGTAAQHWGRIPRKGIPASTSRDADKATSLQVGFPTRSTARQARSIGRTKRWNRSIYGTTLAGLYLGGEVAPIATTAVEEWWPIGTIIHPPAESRLRPHRRLTAHLARAGEPWPIARPPARLESPTLQPIRDRGTPALQIPMECSKMGRTGFCINALRQTLGRFIIRLTFTRIL